MGAALVSALELATARGKSMTNLNAGMEGERGRFMVKEVRAFRVRFRVRVRVRSIGIMDTEEGQAQQHMLLRKRIG